MPESAFGSRPIAGRWIDYQIGKQIDVEANIDREYARLLLCRMPAHLLENDHRFAVQAARRITQI
ncbi:hypothetical protein AYM40_26050 [Paraburkholderia phytofirmans OLGA172]|uniref:Uncharacterized protein n=1 Tax=Paraburkholderia phytofirmans OLGA172 TaxID=1417228 RepID=A0A160FRW3_9BURK|nr:hypothetical protein [Paraburkholderia phytofirmans]ANB75775.1 hypothetical protein AYM40_26050 [Paraburkholderia phytofirmans OLGA172]